MNKSSGCRLIASIILIMSVSAVFPVIALALPTATGWEATVAGGIQFISQADMALPEAMGGVPLVASVAYRCARVWKVEVEFCDILPVEQSVDLTGIGSVDRKMPGILTYQASVLASLPLEQCRWSPYLAAGAGAVTFLSKDEADRLPRLTDTETMFALNFGLGTTYEVGQHWAVRAEFRELIAFPADDAQGMSVNGSADPIWMPRGILGAAYRF